MRYNRYSIFFRMPVKIFGGMVLLVLGACICLPVSAGVQDMGATVGTVSQPLTGMDNQPPPDTATAGPDQYPVVEDVGPAGQPDQPVLISPDAAAEPNQPILQLPEAAAEPNESIPEEATAISSPALSSDTAGTQEQRAFSGLPAAASVPQQAANINQEGLYFILILSIVVLVAGLVIIFLAAWRRRV